MVLIIALPQRRQHDIHLLLRPWRQEGQHPLRHVDDVHGDVHQPLAHDGGAAGPVLGEADEVVAGEAGAAGGAAEVGMPLDEPQINQKLFATGKTEFSSIMNVYF